MGLLKVAILIDGAWFSKVLGPHLQPRVDWPSACQVYSNAVSILEPEEVLWKLLFYESASFAETITNPISKIETDFSKSVSLHEREHFFQELVRLPFVALRRGDVKMRGWKISKAYQKKLIESATPPPLTAKDIFPGFQQKGVDMRIGIDIATIALKKQVDRIFLISGDADMIPAMKLARREGTQVGIIQVGRTKPVAGLVEDSDYLRVLTPSE